MNLGSVASTDGTRIAFSRSGDGPPLILVHGTTADRSRWQRVLPALERSFTVYAMDRRGRGGSGDGPTYSLRNESDDIAAVVQAAGAPAFLLGHSYGALCCLEASVSTGGIARLVLYEPSIPAASVPYPPGLADRFDSLVDSGQRDGAVAEMFRELLGMSDEELAGLRALPSWAVRVASAHTIGRETRAEESYAIDRERLRRMTVPTLLLLGGASPDPLRQATLMLDSMLPDSRVAVMDGQQHLAMSTAPELFVREVVGFLGATAR